MTLPNLLVVGVPKAGTGSLFAYLAQHPEVSPSRRKEIKYFTPDRPDGRSRPLEWYEGFFTSHTGQRYALEATPSYCYMGRTVIDAIRTTLPSPKVIQILRDPVDRLWSAYTFQRSLGHLPRDIDGYDAYVEACLAARRTSPRILDQGDLKGLSIGMYGDQLPGWDRTFGSDLRIVFFDHLARDPAAVLRDLFGWLDVDPRVVEGFSFEARNPTVHPRSVAAARVASGARAMSKRLLRRAPGVRRRLRDAYVRANAGELRERPSPATVERLRSIYAPSNATVARIVGERGIDDVPAWVGAQVSDTTSG